MDKAKVKMLFVSVCDFISNPTKANGDFIKDLIANICPCVKHIPIDNEDVSSLIEYDNLDYTLVTNTATFIDEIISNKCTEYACTIGASIFKVIDLILEQQDQ